MCFLCNHELHEIAKTGRKTAYAAICVVLDTKELIDSSIAQQKCWCCKCAMSVPQVTQTSYPRVNATRRRVKLQDLHFPGISARELIDNSVFLQDTEHGVWLAHSTILVIAVGQ